MEILYAMVVISLMMSFLFLWLFFWAVDNEQLSSMDTARFSVLDEDEKSEG